MWQELMKDALRPEFSMGWDLVLVAVPLVLAFWLFGSPRAWRPALLWWPALVVFILFLPNSPYVITDLIHLVYKVRRDPQLPTWAILVFVIPEYVIYIFAGVQAYTISLMMLVRYLLVRGWGHWATVAELLVHVASAVAIYLGRVLRLNSWEVFQHPKEVVEKTIYALEQPGPEIFIAVMLFFLLVIYYPLKYTNQAIAEHWRRRGVVAE
jgi:uncharacterized membrane protein